MMIQPFSAALWGGLVCILAGCGGGSDGPPRYEVSGTVMFDGRPVPAGEIVFTPDGSQDNRGPGALATIHDGRYQTPPGAGVVGGPHTVRITGQSAASTGPLSESQTLFKPHQTTVDLPKSNTTQDFTIPAAARP